MDSKRLLLDRERLRQTLTGQAPPQAERRAAVAAVLLEPEEPANTESELSLLVIRRAERVGDPWSGHMALPGGHHDPSDRDLIHTALRETREEVGLDLSDAELLGQLDDLTPVRRGTLLVRPYVFAIRQMPTLGISAEVSTWIWAPLGLLASGRADTEHEVTLATGRARFPGYRLGEHVIWGLTYQIVRNLLRQLGDAAPPAKP